MQHNPHFGSIRKRSLDSITTYPLSISQSSLFDGINDIPSSSNDTFSTHKKGRFTLKEDELLIKGVEKYGLKWDTIAEKMNLERSSRQLYNRYKRLAKKMRNRDTMSEFDDEGREKHKRKIPDGWTNSLDKSNHKILSYKDCGVQTPKTNLQERLEKEMQTTKALQEMLDEANKKIQSLEREKSLMSDTISKQNEVIIEKTNRLEITRKELLQVLIEKSNWAIRQLRLQVVKDNNRLGIPTYRRLRVSGAQEIVWEDGEDIIELREQLREYEKEAKKLSEALRNLRSSADTFEKKSDYDLQYEIYERRRAKLNRDKKECKKLIRILESEKMFHLTRTIMVRNQQNCRYPRPSTLKHGDYLLMQLIGKGGFSEVYKGYDIINTRTVAIKIHWINPAWSSEQSRNFIKHSLREYDIQKTLKHKRIVEMLDAFEIDENSFCTVMEYCSGGDLEAELRVQGSLPEKDAKSILIQIMDALKYLNLRKNKVIHYDLKPGNILFNDEGIKITDFGLSKIIPENLSNTDLTSQGSGTYWYLPPECFLSPREQSTIKISDKVDVWSLGVIYYQMLFGKKPFADGHNQRAIAKHKLINMDLTLTIPEKPAISDLAKDFLIKALQPVPENRPSVLELAKHEYLSD